MTSQFSLPLLESVLTVVFMPDPEFDLTLPGLFLNKIQDKYSKKRDIPERKLKLKSLEDSSSEVLSTSITQLISLNGDYAIQIGRDVFTVNQLNKTIDWVDFKSEITSNLEAYCNLLNNKKVRFISLKYLFQAITDTDNGPEFYFNFKYPTFQDTDKEKEVKGFSSRVEFVQENDDILNINLKSQEHGDNKNPYLLEVGVSNPIPEATNIDDISIWLDSAISNIEKGLRISITNELINLYNEAI